MHYNKKNNNINDFKLFTKRQQTTHRILINVTKNKQLGLRQVITK